MWSILFLFILDKPINVSTYVFILECRDAKGHNV